MARISSKCGVSFSSHVGLVGARIKRIMTTDGSLVDIFKLVIAFQRTFDAKRVVRDFRDLGGELYA